MSMLTGRFASLGLQQPRSMADNFDEPYDAAAINA